MTATVRQNTPSSNSLSESMLRKIIPIITIGLILLGMITIVWIGIDARHRLEDRQVTLLNRAKSIIEIEIQLHITTLSNLAHSSEMIYVADGYESIGRAASLTLYSAIATDESRLAARFIGRDGYVHLEVVKQYGNTQTIEHPIEGTYRADIASESGFQSIISGDVHDIVIGSYQSRLTESGTLYNPPRAQFDLLAPVYNDSGRISGVLQLVIDSRDLADLINSATSPDSYIQVAESDHLLLVANNNVYLADSGDLTSNFLANLHPDQGNQTYNALYDVVTDMLLTSDEDFTHQFDNTDIVSARSLDLDRVQGTTWSLVLVSDFFSAYTNAILAVITVIVTTTALGFVITLLLRAYLSRLTRDFEVASELVQQLANEGTISPEGISQNSAPDRLVVAAEHISKRIERLSQEVITQTEQHKRNMQVAGHLGHEMVTIEDLDSLVNRAINLVCTSLGYYHAQVYFIDDFNKFAILSYSRGEAGQKLLDQGHRIPLGMDTNSVVAMAARENRPIIVHDHSIERSKPSS